MPNLTSLRCSRQQRWWWRRTQKSWKRKGKIRTDLHQVFDTSWPGVFLQSQPLVGLCLAGFSGGWGAIFVSYKWRSTHRLGNYTTLRSWHVDSLSRSARLNLVSDERIYFSFIWLDFYWPFHYFPISFPDLLVFSALLSSSVHVLAPNTALCIR